MSATDQSPWLKRMGFVEMCRVGGECWHSAKPHHQAALQPHPVTGRPVCGICHPTSGKGH